MAAITNNVCSCCGLDYVDCHCLDYLLPNDGAGAGQIDSPSSESFYEDQCRSSSLNYNSDNGFWWSGGSNPPNHAGAVAGQINLPSSWSEPLYHDEYNGFCCPMAVESEEPYKMIPTPPSGSSVYPDHLLNNNYSSGGFDEAAAQINLSENQHKKKKARWTAEEHSLFLEGVSKLGKGKWKAISEQFVTSKTKEEIRAHSVYWDQKLAEAANMAPRKKKKGRSRLYDYNMMTTMMMMHTNDHAPTPTPTAVVSLGKFTALQKPMSSMIRTPAAPYINNTSTSSNFMPFSNALAGRTSSPFNVFNKAPF